jgi:hypothetical protein
VLLGGAGTAAAVPAADGYALQVEQVYLTAEVGGTVTVSPEVLREGIGVPEGSPLGPGAMLQYLLPAHTTPVDVPEGCRKRGTKRAPLVSCTKVRPLTLRIDRALVAEDMSVAVFPNHPTGPLSNEEHVFLTAPVPREEGETPESRKERQTVGAALLGTGGAFALLSLFLARSRRRRAIWVSCTVVAALCAAPGVWSLARGPLAGAKSYTRYPSGPPVLTMPETVWDSGWIRTPQRPDNVPAVATAPDTGHENVEEVSGLYLPDGSEPRVDWLAVDGAYGRIEDPRRARDHMLRTAAAAPGATVVEKPRLFLLKGQNSVSDDPVLFKCQVIRIRDQHVSQCAWADKGVRALCSRPHNALLETARRALSIREYVQLGGGF